MIISKNCRGEIASITFEPEDRLRDIASVCRCTAGELAELMRTIWMDDWAGQEIDWGDE